MLSILGFLTIAVFTYLVMSRRMIAFTAIIFVPIVFALIGGFGPQLGEMMGEGVVTVADTAVLLLFAILYFGIMMDAGLFDPLSNAILRIAKGDPVKIAMGTAVLALTVALDGDGTTTYMIVCSAMLPVYKRLGMNPLILATLAIMALGIVAGSTPWGGSATRAISILGLNASDYFIPMLPVIAGGSIFTLFIAYMLGKGERKRLGKEVIEQYRSELAMTTNASGEKAKKSNMKLVWFNLFLTLTLMGVLIADVVELYLLFIIGFGLALIVNYPNLDDQKKVIKEHASNAIPVVSLVLGAGIFTGILQGTAMVDHMAGDIVGVIPESFGDFYTIIVALICLPLSFFMSNDAFFFGALPVFAEAGTAYGVEPMDVARASVIGQTIHLIGPTSAPLWVLIELIRTDLGKLQRYTLPWIILSAVVMIGIAILTGAISL
ncbi:CitMHS family transporter [Domibacillus enclensis]|uniref:Citrate-Mg2+:H+ or citrate-Ca2+:H+ symporter, CitMHS family n=1 Tax=Domibacillus enclensis TaxID=1017273 RepID=A0A1N6V4T2_9BACI|nr:citrate:proton symporter [Domibacillus enclensis]OXS78697.1 damage-inducible protein CinA [Domibacillus enclensis]SIQ72828.1 citrate-Mg2+:H+ or citrate-Ca2+:H+ symporter, CitMHS family [Domibacillus enclensis]